MVTPQTIKDLNEAFKKSRGGFVVVEGTAPRFAVIDYKAYQKLARKKSKKNPVKILVTGGAGYVGSHACRCLQERGYEAVVYDNLSTGREEAVRGKLVVADLSDRVMLDKVFAEGNFDAVMHFAASVEVEESTRNPAKYFQNNVAGGLNLLDAMISHNVYKLIFSSTAAVYGQPESVPIPETAPLKPLSPYGETKLMFEQILKWYNQAYGLHSITLRYFNAAGAWAEEGLGYNRQAASHLIPRVMDVAVGKNSEIEIFGNDYHTPDGTAIRDYIHVLDLAEAHLLALAKLEGQNGCYVYNVGTGLGNSVLEVIDHAVEITRRMIPIKMAGRRMGDPAAHVADASLFQKEFDWKPKHNIQSILESAWKWHTLRSTNEYESTNFNKKL